MRQTLTLVLLSLLAMHAFAQEKANTPKVQFYGFVRGDFSFDTRRNVAANEGLFLLYPTNVSPDANGADLNKIAASAFYAFNSRAGVNVGGFNALGGEMTAKIEADFAGFGSTFGANSSLLRIRQAYVKLLWPHSSLLAGQAWHPMFAPVMPYVISLAAGAPFNPFARNPQIRYDYKMGGLTLCGAAIWQFQFSSTGPLGKSTTYQRDAIAPELFAGIDYKRKGLTAGAGVDYLTIKPRTQSTIGSDVFKVDESLGSVSMSAYLEYVTKMFSVAAKTIYGQNLSELTMIGGYGVHSRDAATGEQTYTNFRHTTTWISMTYGRKFMGGLFGGFTKSLGTGRSLITSSPAYGEGLKLSNLYRLAGTFSYNIPHFTMGVEYEMTCARYGDEATFENATGKYGSSHGVTNHRAVAVFCYTF